MSLDRREARHQAGCEQPMETGAEIESFCGAQGVFMGGSQRCAQEQGGKQCMATGIHLLHGDLVRVAPYQHSLWLAGKLQMFRCGLLAKPPDVQNRMG